ncbi:unnamed protein product [Peniophora sp. CBMAI 1063]|nr:unnamed protein product [Peniophora sp. CBMAI 1063]
MFPRKPRQNFGSPEEQPDITTSQIGARLEAWLHSWKGPPLEDAANLRARRLRSAVAHIHRALVNQPEMSSLQFAQAWRFLRDQVAEAVSQELFTAGPVIGWAQELANAERVDLEVAHLTPDAPPQMANVRRFFYEHGWPADQVMPSRTGRASLNLGPGQWWGPFVCGRRITRENIARWDASRRKTIHRRRQTGQPFPSDSEEGEGGEEGESGVTDAEVDEIAVEVEHLLLE